MVTKLSLKRKPKRWGDCELLTKTFRSLKELVHYGIKGMAAYVEHAYNLGYENPEIFAFMQYALAELTREDITVDEL